MNEPLSHISYLEITDYFWKEKHRRNADRYFGLMFDSDELEKILKNKYFAVNENANGVKAVIFDNEVECNAYCMFATEYCVMNFEEFKSLTGDKWKLSQYYHALKGKDWIIYLSGSRYDLEGIDLQ